LSRRESIPESFCEWLFKYKIYLGDLCWLVGIKAVQLTLIIQSRVLGFARLLSKNAGVVIKSTQLGSTEGSRSQKHPEQRAEWSV
jgi:hypothetical protein